jgi:uncharacterized membrane protein
VSTFTGLPTVLGWDQHEFWWRGGAWDLQAGRKEDVERIYNTHDAAEAKRLMERYSVDYVYVGWLEREKYKDADFSKFAAFMDVALQNDEVTIYRMPGKSSQIAANEPN